MISAYQQEIYEQPDVHRLLLANYSAKIKEIAGIFRNKNYKFILIAARGTSDNAATYAKYLFSSMVHIPTGLAIPSLYTIYDQVPDMRGGLVIGISQSGQGSDILAVLKQAHAAGVDTLTITNDIHSPMAEISDYVIDVCAGKENAVAASKSYTGEALAVAMLAAAWAGDEGKLKEIEKVPEWASFVLDQHENVKKAARWYAEIDKLIILGRGYNHCTTSEIALKVKEITYVTAEAFSGADFRHGPIALLEDGFPVVALAPAGKTLADMQDLIREVKERKVRLSVISNDEHVLGESDYAIRLPADLTEWLSPIVVTIPGQLLALELAVVKGLDIDHPRGLKKVTLTM